MSSNTFLGLISWFVQLCPSCPYPPAPKVNTPPSCNISSEYGVAKERESMQECTTARLSALSQHACSQLMFLGNKNVARMRDKTRSKTASQCVSTHVFIANQLSPGCMLASSLSRSCDPVSKLHSKLQK